MYRNKYTMLFHSLILLTILLRFIVFNEPTVEVTVPTNEQGVPIEVDLDDEIYYFDKSISHLIIDGRTLTQHDGYYVLNENLEDQKGIIITTKDFILLKDLNQNPDFTFISTQDLDMNLVLFDLDDYYYGIGIHSNTTLLSTTFNSYPHSDHYFKKAQLAADDEYYLLYKIDKFTLDTISSNGIILYNLDNDDVEIYNDLNDINYKDELTWKKGESILLSELV